MYSIDIVILGLVYQEPMSAYDIQKSLVFRNIDKWTRISIPSIYKKVIVLSKKGYLAKLQLSNEKATYKITDSGKKYYNDGIQYLITQEVDIFLDFNSVIAGFGNISISEQKNILRKIKEQILNRKLLLEEQTNIKKNIPIPIHGLQLLKQQLMLANSLLKWVDSYLDIF